MSRREFHFSEGTSNKFWAIAVTGKSQTVHYGKIGTAGQTQTKEFATEDDARKASDKLIAEKVKKGYTEVASADAPAAVAASAAPAAVPKQLKRKSPAAAEPEAEPPPAAKPEARAAAVTSQTSAPPPTTSASAGITRTIDLSEDDLRQAEWPKKWRPQPRPPVRPFDREQCIRAFLKAAIKNTHWNFNWPSVCIQPGLSPHEAQFWLLTMVEPEKAVSKQEAVAQRLAKFTLTGRVTYNEAFEILQGIGNAGASAVLPLSIFLTADEIVTLCLHDWKDRWGHNHVSNELVARFARYVLPYLDENEVARLQDRIRPLLNDSLWASSHGAPPLANLAAHLGMVEELRSGLATMDAGAPAPTVGKHLNVRFWVLNLGKPEWILAEGQRLKLRFTQPKEIRRWLASTRFAGLDIVRDSILESEGAYDYSAGHYEHYSAKEQAERLIEEFARVKAPEAAPFMLELKLSSKGPAVARKWLDEQVGNAIAGLIPVAAGRGKLADAAVDYLRDAKKKGHEPFIRDCLAAVAPEVAESIRKHVLDYAERDYATVEIKALPAKLKAAFAAPAKKAKLPEWAAPTTLPPVLIGDRKLDDDAVRAVLDALRRSTLAAPDPLVVALKESADATALDAFAWKLFQLWQGEGCPPKEKWAMGAVGLVGGDASALKLTPLVRNWPGESQHQRAVFGLECLRGIGTDTALMQLNGIAQKLKFKGLKEKAAQAMEAIASAKGLTRSQLEDRVVPDCDLDARGSRSFDFGPRQFRFVLGPDLKPMLKDADGKVKTDLPKPTAKDDPAKSAQAVGDWKLLKKQIKEVTAVQAQRLEQAMITGRRWPVADFESLLVKHPLMINLVRLLLWGGYDAKGKLVQTFRVTEDQTCADIKDNDCKLAGLETVGIVHPLHLTAEQQSAWGEVFSDYEIVPPFRQLGRRIVRPEKEEFGAEEITRFKGIAVPAPTLVYGLEKQGWTRGAGMDGGCFDEHSKQFPSSNVTAVVHYDGTVGYGYIDPNDTLKLEVCYFVSGLRGPSGYQPKEKKLKIGDVDPVAVSEVLTDISALAAKGR